MEGIKIFEKEKETLVQLFKKCGYNSRTSGKRSLNLYILSKELNYEIISDPNKRRKIDGEKNPNRDKTYWMIEQINN